jgi:hypothetical protein
MLCYFHAHITPGSRSSQWCCLIHRKPTSYVRMSLLQPTGLLGITPCACRACFQYPECGKTRGVVLMNKRWKCERSEGNMPHWQRKLPTIPYNSFCLLSVPLSIVTAAKTPTASIAPSAMQACSRRDNIQHKPMKRAESCREVKAFRANNSNLNGNRIKRVIYIFFAAPVSQASEETVGSRGRNVPVVLIIHFPLKFENLPTCLLL